ncbi:hypothetical protein, partial [Agreia bicolorata]|uniref:hypothetical protein n=1 Tax=Agreia bicolorata TaxID=110935 RepID=UPI001C6FCB67
VRDHTTAEQNQQRSAYQFREKYNPKIVHIDLLSCDVYVTLCRTPHQAVDYTISARIVGAYDLE